MISCSRTVNRHRVFVLAAALLLLITTAPVCSQTIDDYVKMALANNSTLIQKKYACQKSREALKEANRNFLPVLSVEARYARSEGGRTATIPFGDMLNPIYSNLTLANSTLSRMTSAYPSLPAYPQVDNYTLNFIRPTEQETKLQLVMPVFNTDVIFNRSIKSSLVTVDDNSLELYKRELIKSVKTAYLTYFRTIGVVVMYQNSMVVVNRHLQNTHSLYANEKLTIDEVYAAQAQVKDVEQKLSDAEKNSKMAAAYFNFLLNRDLDAAIATAAPYPIAAFSENLDSLRSLAMSQRMELAQMDELLDINDKQISMESSRGLLPQVSLGASYGYQGDKYEFNKQNDFAQVGLSLSWTFFSSGQREAKVEQAKMERRITEQKKTEAAMKIQMEVMDAYYSAVTARKGIDRAADECANQKKIFQLVEKKHSLGSANRVEYANAFANQLNAEEKVIVAQYEFQTCMTTLEYAVGNAGYQTSTSNDHENE